MTTVSIEREKLEQMREALMKAMQGVITCSESAAAFSIVAEVLAQPAARVAVGWLGQVACERYKFSSCYSTCLKGCRHF